MNVKYS